jgi:uncharacterized membrane protein
MLNTYLVIKLIHILSATILFGTGLGTAFFMYKAHRDGGAETIRVTSRHVVLADWIFTTPAIVVQLATGLWLADYLQIPWSSAWLVSVALLFAAVGACWLPVVWIQIRIKRLSESAAPDLTAARCAALMRSWIALGVPAFTMMLALFALMVLKPGIR